MCSSQTNVPPTQNCWLALKQISKSQTALSYKIQSHVLFISTGWLLKWLTVYPTADLTGQSFTGQS